MDDIKATLLEDLLTHFDEVGLRQFCEQLGDIAYDDLAGHEPSGKMVHLIAYMERRGQGRRLVQYLTNLRPQLTSKYRFILHESDRFQVQAAAIDDALSWLDELAAGQGTLLDQLPTMTWPTENEAVRPSKQESKLSWLDQVAQGSGRAIDEGPTMSWPEPADEPVVEGPYQVGGAIRHVDHFFGRDVELHRLRSRLLDMGSSIILGLPHVGKSSLLYALTHVEPLPTEQRYLLAYLNLANGRFAQQAQTTLLNGAWQQWVSQVGDKQGSLAESTNYPIRSLTDFARWVRAFHRHGYRLILCLDGFAEASQPDDLLDESLLALWHDLGNEGLMAFVLVTERPLSALLPSGLFRSDFETIFYQLELGLLTEAAARRLLTEPAQQAGVTMPKAVVERWLDYCGPYPIFVQMAGRLLWQALSENGRLSSADEAALQYKFRQQAAPYWQQIWQSLSAEARQAFPRQLVVAESPAQRIIYHFLTRRGLLIAEDSHYRPFSNAFVYWLSQRKEDG